MSGCINRRRLWLTGIAAAALTLGAAPAPAAAHKISPREACGPGYFVVKDGRRPIPINGPRWGTVYLMYNRSTGTNCVVTIKKRWHGMSTRVGAQLKVRGRRGPCAGWFCENDHFTHYAGGLPQNKTVAYARGRCVKYYGFIFDPAGEDVAGNGRWEFGNCRR